MWDKKSRYRMCFVERLFAKQDMGMTNDWFIEFRIPAMIFSGQISMLFWTMWKAVWNESNIGFLESG